MSFDQAFVRTLGAEGGYSNNPADPGGKTLWGITEAVARAHGYNGIMSEMSMATAKGIYRDGYWDLLHLADIDKLSPAISAEMFDTAVNMGASVPVPFLQRALNAFNRQGKAYPDMPVDGLVGARTIDALRRYLLARPTDGERVMLSVLNAQQGERYLKIVERRPASEDFVYGWFRNRIAA